MDLKTLRAYLFCLALLFPLLSFGKGQNKPMDHYLKQKLSFATKFDSTYAICYDSSDSHTDKCLRIMRQLKSMAEKQNDSLRMARADFLIGYSYGVKENYVLALEYLFKSLPAAELYKDTTLLVSNYNSIGIAYSKQKQNKKAVGYFLKIVDIARLQNKKFMMAIAYNNTAIEYQNLKQYSTADKYLRKALEIFKDKPEFHTSIYMNMGVNRFDRGQLDSSLYYYYKAKAYYLKYNDPELPAHIANNLGELHYHLKNYDSSLYYLNYSLSKIDTLNDKYSLRETYKHLANLHESLGNLNKAYYYLKRHNYLNNIILDNETLKRTLASEANFELLKKDNELKLNQEQQKRDKEKQLYQEKKARLFYIFGAITGILLVVALVIAIRRFKEKKKANEELTEQKNRIQEQQNEITDSINYARNIQQSILPSDDFLKKTLNDYLLFYQPRDIVGGDFYFVETMGNRTYFAVVDCTGHGVPGGFMSILGFNGLQKCLHDFNLKQPAEILDALSKLVVKHFTHQGKQALRDGMDIALCCIYEENGKIILEYAGANNPLWIIKKRSNELVEVPANKQPIGYFENFKPFTHYSTEVEKSDIVYLFSDGYADQFGGPSGKKFKYSQLKGLLQIQSAHMSMHERETLLKTSFEEWRSTYEQLDDVCVLGVRI